MLKTVNILNKRARFDYEILETYTAGIVLTGTEIKSIRFYCMFKHDYFDLITQNAKELTFSLAHLNTDNKKLSLACQKLMGMEKAYGWDETDLRCKNNII